MEKQSERQDFTIGNKTMDLEHHLQIGLIDALEDSVRGGKARTEITAILSQLYEFTNGHFLAENLLMRLHGYPEYQEHANEHDALSEILEGLRRKFEPGGPSLTPEAIDTFRGNLTAHILGMDQRLSEYVAEHGIPAMRRS
jgi:hemerythrin-like metal-binding protein